MTSITDPKWLKNCFANLFGGKIIIGPCFISIGGNGITLIIFFEPVNFFKLLRLIVEIKLIIFFFIIKL